MCLAPIIKVIGPDTTPALGEEVRAPWKRSGQQEVPGLRAAPRLAPGLHPQAPFGRSASLPAARPRGNRCYPPSGGGGKESWGGFAPSPRSPLLSEACKYTLSRA